jgi:acetate---CoA ligase (ADP-forming) subunit beta
MSAGAILKAALKEGRDHLLEPEALELCRLYDILISEWRFAEDASDAEKLSKELGFPIVMKVVTPELLHKSQEAGVALGLRNSREVKSRFKKLEQAFMGSKKGIFLGVILQKQVEQGLEVIVGAFQDPQFGPCVMLGLGGIFAELVPDLTFRLIPVTREDAESMLSEIAGGRLLTGLRGHLAFDRERLIRIILSVSKMMNELEELSSVELNPVVLRDDRGVVVDAKAALKRANP